MPFELSTERIAKDLVPIEVTPSPIQLGGGLSLVTPRGFRVEGLTKRDYECLARLAIAAENNIYVPIDDDR